MMWGQLPPDVDSVLDGKRSAVNIHERRHVSIRISDERTRQLSRRNLRLMKHSRGSFFIMDRSGSAVAFPWEVRIPARECSYLRIENPPESVNRLYAAVAVAMAASKLTDP